MLNALKNTTGHDTPKTNPSLKEYAMFLFIIVVFSAVSYRATLPVLGMLLPFVFLKKDDIKIYIVVGSILCLKILFATFTDPGAAYSYYDFNWQWMVRESVTIFLFFAWLRFGQNIVTGEKISHISNGLILLSFALLYTFLLYYSHSVVIRGIDNLVVLFLTLSYIVIVTTEKSLMRWLIVAMIVGTALIPMQSSYTIICSAFLICLAFFKEFSNKQIVIPWRSIAIAGVIFLVFVSSYAYLIHLRPETASGEGNNGYTRAFLAQIGYEQFFKDPFIGSPLGRGILPTTAVEELGWWQYFTGNPNFNIYALSFHNSFIYMLTRFGIFSFIFFWILFRQIPKSGRVEAVGFTLVLFLGCGANVVIESIRAAPAVGFALGLIISLHCENIKKDKKPKLPLKDLKPKTPQATQV